MTTRRERLELAKLESEVFTAELSNAHDRHRVLTILDELDEKTVRRAIDKLGLWSRAAPDVPIEIVLTSPGGWVFEGFALYDEIVRIVNEGTHVTIRALGYVASMATVLLQAASVRVIGPNAWMMLHEVNGASWGNTSTMRDETELTEALEARVLEILSERSTLTVAQIRHKIRRKEWWIPAEQALALDLVDEIL